MDNQEIMVSVLCATYNQESYIRDAIESFLMQKTNFAFEILMHDDASTDGTADIIREYEQKYPDLIKPIYQTVNQYSQGISYTNKFQIPRAKGKYIALCDGDDYWTDPLKLQKQFDAMEAHPEVDMCAHAADVVEAETKKFLRVVAPCDKDTIISVEQVISSWKYLCATSSLFFRKQLNDTLPRFRQFYSIDLFTEIHGALRGGILYLSEKMSAYRRLAKGSWTVNIAKDVEAKKAQLNKGEVALRILDEETNYKYHDLIEERILARQFACEDRKGIFQKKYKKLYKRFPFKTRIKMRLDRYFPWLIKIKRKLFGKKG